MGILQAIGITSLVKLRTIVPAGSADILVKLEWENPTGARPEPRAAHVLDGPPASAPRRR